MAGLSESFGATTKQITFALTLTLLFRSLGALIFGILADRYGRKWTLTGNLLFVAVFELGSAFCQTYEQFLAVRSMFGIGMGGIWGSAASASPTPSLQSVIKLMIHTDSAGKHPGSCTRTLLGFSAARHLGRVPIGRGGQSRRRPKGDHRLASTVLDRRRSIGSSRSCTSRSTGIRGVRSGEARGQILRHIDKASDQELLQGSRLHDAHQLAAVDLGHLHHDRLQLPFARQPRSVSDLSASHQRVLSPFDASQTTIVSNCGAIIGGTIAGYASQYLGRRLCLLLVLCYTAAWIPLWILPSSHAALTAGGFFIQSGVQGAWGLVPIYLGEISPPAFRASFAGLAYQLGNMASSGAAQIEAAAGETVKLPGTKTPDYVSPTQHEMSLTGRQPSRPSWSAQY